MKGPVISGKTRYVQSSVGNYAVHCKNEKRKHMRTGTFLLEEATCRTKLWESVGV